MSPADSPPIPSSGGPTCRDFWSRLNGVTVLNSGSLGISSDLDANSRKIPRRDSRRREGNEFIGINNLVEDRSTVHFPLFFTNQPLDLSFPNCCCCCCCCPEPSKAFHEGRSIVFLSRTSRSIIGGGEVERRISFLLLRCLEINTKVLDPLDQRSWSIHFHRRVVYSMVNCLRYTRVRVDYYSRLVYAGLLVDGYRLSNTPSCRCIVTGHQPTCKLFTTLRCTINRESQWLVTSWLTVVDW